ncbi:MAG: serine/threonine protein kinase [Planctomycetaceae bacterium]|nr:serine/threonine protein kinase [Planctomycetaceae bacterium]
MAPSTESNPPSKEKEKDSKGLSSFNELNLERSIIKRGLATPEEIERCKAYKAKLASKEDSRGLLEIMVEANVLTRNQAIRILKALGESAKKLEIPGYQILEKLGKGSMGVVYKARQIAVDRIVAVKILLSALAQNKEFITRFGREAKIAAKLSHNNIVNAIDAGEVNGYHYFVMEYVEGSTIKDTLDKGQVFEEKEALEIVLAVAEALKHAHDRGLIHRDIKPENVILTKHGGVKLADLGLARLTADEKWAMSEAGMAIGTPYYISPEQVRGQVDVDIRADIYSLGATLYHMVTGRVPYEGETSSDVMRKHVDKNVPFVPPDHVNTDLSSGLGVVVETMMAKNRENRYRNPDDLIFDLRCLLQGESPMIAGQKTESLAVLAEGDIDEVIRHATEARMVEWAAYVNSRYHVIVALAAMLGFSIITNIVFLTTRRP